MKHHSLTIPFTFATIASLVALPSFAQTPTQPSQALQPASDRVENSLTFIYGTVSSLNGSQFTLNRGSSQTVINTGQYIINLVANEPISVTGTLNSQTGQIDAYSITRSTGTNITLLPQSASIQPPIPGLSGLPTAVRRVQ